MSVKLSKNITSTWKKADWLSLDLPFVKSKKEGVALLKLIKKLQFQDNLVKNKKISSKEEVKKLFNTVNKIKEAIPTITNKLNKFVSNSKTNELPVPWKKFHKSVKIQPNSKNIKDYHKYFKVVSPALQQQIFSFMYNKGNKRTIKVQYNIKVVMEKLDPVSLEVIDTQEFPFYSGYVLEILNVKQIKPVIELMKSRIITKIEKFVRGHSMWRIKQMKEGYINVMNYNPINAGSYIELPDVLKNKKAITNLQNKDNKCFDLHIVAGLHRQELKKAFKNPKSLKPFRDLLKNYSFPEHNGVLVANESISIYEDIIKHNINVLIYDDNKVKPHYSSGSDYPEEINLLLIGDDNGNYHYTLINDVSKLLCEQVDKHKHKLFYCMSCFYHTRDKNLIKEHRKSCTKKGVCKIGMPEKDLKFTNWGKTLRVPFVTYGDFEAINEKVTNGVVSGKTEKKTIHKVSGGNYITIKDNEIVNEEIFFGEHSDRELVKSLVKSLENLHYQNFYEKKPIKMTNEDWDNYNTSKHCHICGEGFSMSLDGYKKYQKDNEKLHPEHPVRDHCHLTGTFRGKAHNSCNLLYRQRSVFPVIFHNLKGYDGHLIVKALGKDYVKNVKVIPMNREKFISFSLMYRVKRKGKDVVIVDEDDNEDTINFEEITTMEIRFIDSFNFMNTSLEKLSDILEDNDFKLTMDFVNRISGDLDEQSIKDRFKLLRKKGVYPYDYMDNFDKFKYQLPETDDAYVNTLEYETDRYSKLNDKQKANVIKDKLHAKLVYKTFGCENMRHYHDLYLKSDVFLLADIFERFRNIAMDKFKLDPCHYYTLPSMAFDALLKYTKIELELFKEGQEDMYFFMEDAKIGGISGTGGKRYAKANNKYLEGYDKNVLSNFIMYCDANGLYSWAMSQKLPVGSFKWIPVEEFDLQKAYDNIDSDFGYFLEVDVELPEKFHDQQNDFPCFPENIVIEEEYLSPLQMDLKERLNCGDAKVPKLTCNLLPKTKYKIHIKCLKLYCSLGWKITKIHRVLEFKQKAWMKPYIDLCMNERKKTNNEFEKDFWKLSANAVYGKTMENVRNRCNIKLVLDEEKAQKLTNKPTLKTAPELIGEELYLFEMNKETITLDKPIYVGIAILNISKYLMYDFFYNTLRVKYPSCRLLYTDTDSFVFEVFTDDLYKDIEDDLTLREYFDFSNYPKDHPLYDEKNKKVVGKFKDETQSKIIKECIALKAKQYYIGVDTEIEKDKEKKTGKGIKKAVLNNIEQSRYFNAIFHNNDEKKMIYNEKMTFIRSQKHTINTVTINKVCITSFDDKKTILDDNTEQISFGHWRLEKMKQTGIYRL